MRKGWYVSRLCSSSEKFYYGTPLAYYPCTDELDANLLAEEFSREGTCNETIYIKEDL